MGIWAQITDFFSWPPGWDTLLAVATGLALPRVSWRGLVAFVALGSLLCAGLIWLGPALGLVTLIGKAATLHLAGFELRLPPGVAHVGSFFAAAVAVNVWHRLHGPARDPNSPEAKHAAGMRHSHWALLYGLSQIVLVPLSFLVHMATIFATGAGVPGMVLTMFTPVVAQVYWVAAIWWDTGSLTHPVTRLFALWLCVVAIFLLARWKSGIRAAGPGRASAPPMPPVWPRRHPTATSC